ncbi:cytochrome P450 [Xylariomycetidae sp. FL2044]|nr:cytochrome P450 [Xylariomycetidae sp. FL2044]
MATPIFVNTAFADLMIFLRLYSMSICILYILMLFGYRLFLHPLSGYPGPLVAKVFEGYDAFYALFGNSHIVTRQDHMKYGPVIRQGPNKLIFNSAKALHDIYDNERVQKSKVYLATRLSPHFNIFNVMDKQTHRMKRRIIGNVLSERSMRLFEPTMQRQMDIYLQELLRCARSHSPVNMTLRAKFLALDIIGHLAFGYDLRLQTDTVNRHMVGALKAGNYRLNIYMQYPLLAKLYLEVVVYLFKLMQKENYLKLLEQMIAARLQEDQSAKHDLYSIVADAIRSPEQEKIAPASRDSITLNELWSEALFFFPAGGESITTTICSVFFYLSRNPPSYQRLAEEIRTTFSSADDIRDGSRLSGCQYLRACIDEALRMAPPAPGTLWREKSSSDDDANQPLIIDGHVIPKGTMFGVNNYTLHHNEKYFPDSFTFKPERWLPSLDISESQWSLMNSAFAPFSLGSRGCGGKAMAYLEVSLVIAKTIWFFDFERAPGKLGDLGGGSGATSEVNGGEREDEFQLDDIFTADHDGPNLVFIPRQEVIGELKR